jgi:hypothetical protein
MSIGKLEPVDLRKMFPDEARDFTPWLQDNIEVLSERLGIELTVVEREKQVGSFSLDLLAEGSNGEMVIIENQLYRTDHDHLGKVLTYLVNLDAKTAIWVTPEVRPEHMRVFQWLNENTPADVQFFLVKVEAFKIGESAPAPLFTVYVQATPTGKATGQAIQEHSKSDKKRLDFWTGFIERSRDRTDLFRNVSPSKSNWLEAATGRSGFSYYGTINKGNAYVELYIGFDNASETGEGNKRVFDELHEQKADIQQEFGDSLEWERRENKTKYSSIRKYYRDAGLDNEDKWDEIQEWMLDKWIKLDAALRERVAKLKL